MTSLFNLFQFLKKDRQKDIDIKINDIVASITSGEYSDVEISEIVNHIRERTIVFLLNKKEKLNSDIDTVSKAIDNFI